MGETSIVKQEMKLEPKTEFPIEIGETTIIKQEMNLEPKTEFPVEIGETSIVKQEIEDTSNVKQEVKLEPKTEFPVEIGENFIIKQEVKLEPKTEFSDEIGETSIVKQELNLEPKTEYPVEIGETSIVKQEVKLEPNAEFPVDTSLTYKKCQSTFYRRRHAEVKAKCQELKNGEIQYRCDVCGLVDDKFYTFIVHYLDHLVKNRVPKVNTHKQIQNKGRIVENGEVMYKCDVCGKIMKDKKRFAFHILKHSREGYPDRKQYHPKILDLCAFTGDDGIPMFRCVLCEKLWTKANHMINHFVFHKEAKEILAGKGDSYKLRNEEIKKRCTFVGQDGEDYYKCNLCHKMLEEDAVLGHYRDHVQRGHVDASGNLTPSTKEALLSEAVKAEVRERCLTALGGGKVTFRCEFCGKMFRKLAHMLTHYHAHSDKITHACGLCSFKDMYKCMLEDHMRQNHGYD